MMTKAKLALATLICLAAGHPAQAQSLTSTRNASPEAVSFLLFPPGPADRIRLAVPAPRSVKATGVARRSVVFTGTPARKLKQLIGHVDAGRMDYDAVQHGARIRPARRPTRMTIREIFDWIDRTPGQPHAIGRYQFIPPTLRSVVRQAGVGVDTVFSPEVQDRLADILLADAGFHEFQSGQIARKRFMENLARIWAAFPTSTGRSHYHGIAGNRAVISWQEFEMHMRQIFQSSTGA
ncbi:hypothetical protein OB2597_19226 [Pseudooceanicola batsensis HTCC2597]|uniref:Uncharacterized protein n=1 Tax=Pseudooceanicola batsensis (strain ATCC BAA-863 / DSM 15984 / KCTC 12145 / HTCC2597) TaxID=252305 RepID=A3U0F5_PSEBH|nr:hypothetical protein [Pseudooceanicola batsensis]EAQ02246.1 hypothetical protein OB2597_19226 [Pseudooceanicola batsensis HTCC2597]